VNITETVPRYIVTQLLKLSPLSRSSLCVGAGHSPAKKERRDTLTLREQIGIYAKLVAQLATPTNQPQPEWGRTLQHHGIQTKQTASFRRALPFADTFLAARWELEPANIISKYDLRRYHAADSESPPCAARIQKREFKCPRPSLLESGKWSRLDIETSQHRWRPKCIERSRQQQSSPA
jgi:hypothetical protein